MANTGMSCDLAQLSAKNCAPVIAAITLVYYPTALNIHVIQATQLQQR